MVENKIDTHPVCTFAAAKVYGDKAKAAYAVYDRAEKKTLRCVTIQGVTQHRALLMAVWSALRYCSIELPQNIVTVYCTEDRVPEELNSIWYENAKFSDYEDADRIEQVIDDCAKIYRVTFGNFPMNGDPMWRKIEQEMQEVLDLVNTKA